MSDTATKETIAQRIERGKVQNSTDGGAIVPFPDDSDFHDPIAMMRNSDRTWLVGHLNGGASLSPFIYRSEQAEPIFGVLRTDHPENGKDIRPFRCDRIVGILGKGVLRGLDGERPLYNLHKLAARPTDTVLFVEGEKTAEAAGAIFPSYVCTTWPGGAQSVQKVELLPLIGRDAAIWPDNDDEGRKAARTLARNLLLAGAKSCRIVDLPADLPPKWDLADADTSDTAEMERVRGLLASGPMVTLAELEPKPSAQPRPNPNPSPGAGSDLARHEALLRFLIEQKLIDLDGRGDWIKVGMALHSSHGDAALPLWDQLSFEAAK